MSHQHRRIWGLTLTTMSSLATLALLMSIAVVEGSKDSREAHTLDALYPTLGFPRSYHPLPFASVAADAATTTTTPSASTATSTSTQQTKGSTSPTTSPVNSIPESNKTATPTLSTTATTTTTLSLNDKPGVAVNNSEVTKTEHTTPNPFPFVDNLKGNLSSGNKTADANATVSAYVPPTAINNNKTANTNETTTATDNKTSNATHNNQNQTVAPTNTAPPPVNTTFSLPSNNNTNSTTGVNPGSTIKVLSSNGNSSDTKDEPPAIQNTWFAIVPTAVANGTTRTTPAYVDPKIASAEEARANENNYKVNNRGKVVVPIGKWPDKRSAVKPKGFRKVKVVNGTLVWSLPINANSSQASSPDPDEDGLEILADGCWSSRTDQSCSGHGSCKHDQYSLFGIVAEGQEAEKKRCLCHPGFYGRACHLSVKTANKKVWKKQLGRFFNNAPTPQELAKYGQWPLSKRLKPKENFPFVDIVNDRNGVYSHKHDAFIGTKKSGSIRDADEPVSAPAALRRWIEPDESTLYPGAKVMAEYVREKLRVSVANHDEEKLSKLRKIYNMPHDDIVRYALYVSKDGHTLIAPVIQKDQAGFVDPTKPEPSKIDPSAVTLSNELNELASNQNPNGAKKGQKLRNVAPLPKPEPTPPPPPESFESCSGTIVGKRSYALMCKKDGGTCCSLQPGGPGTMIDPSKPTAQCGVCYK